MVRVEDDAAFTVADGMALGAVVNGNLRIVATIDGKDTAIEIPHKWLHPEGGLRHFIQSECWPSGSKVCPTPYACTHPSDHQAGVKRDD